MVKEVKMWKWKHCKIVWACEEGFQKKIKEELRAQGWDSIVIIWLSDEGRFASIKESKGQVCNLLQNKVGVCWSCCQVQRMVGVLVEHICWVLLGRGVG